MFTLSLKQISKILLTTIVCLLMLLATKTALADDVVVTASVPFAVPTQAAVINNPSGVTVTSAQLLVTGTCEIMNPAAIVSLWRGGSLLGATTCQSGGAFSLTVQLAAGQNSIVPKTSNIVNIYGPEGAAVLYTYNPPAIVGPSQETPAQSTEAAAVGSPALQVSSPQPFGILSKTGTVSVDVTVQGGDTPYVIEIKWGDGKTDTKTATEPGTYTFTHDYKQSKDYVANVKVTDKKGISSEFSVPFADVKGVTAKRVQAYSSPAIISGNTVTVSAVVLGSTVAAVGAGTFVLGQQHQIRIHKRTSVKKMPKRPGRR